MRVNILIFGQLADVTGMQKLVVDDVPDTEHLLTALTGQYPSLANYKFVVAVDKKLVNTNTTLHDNCTVALMPPFSGG